MKRLTKLILIGAGVAVAGIVTAAVFNSRKPKIVYDTVMATPRKLVQSVQASGSVISAEDVELKFESSGRVKAIPVEVGDAVKVGTTIATLHDSDARIIVQKADAAYLSVKASLDTLTAGASAEDIRISEIAVAKAEDDVAAAKQAFVDAQVSIAASLEKAYGDLHADGDSIFLKSTVGVQTLAKDVFDDTNVKNDITVDDTIVANQGLTAYIGAKSALQSMGIDILSLRTAPDHVHADLTSQKIIDEAKRIRDAAQLANMLMQDGKPAGSTTQAAFDARREAVKMAWSDLNASVATIEAQKRVIVSLAATNATSLNVAKQAVINANNMLASAQASLAFKKAPAARASIEAAQAGVAQAQAGLAEAQNALGKTVIRAPFDGTVAQIIARVGATVTGADVIARLRGQDQFVVEADVPETDVGKLHGGLSATLMFDAFGDDREFPAELASIDSGETVIQDVVYYKTRFRLTSGQEDVRAGMTASVTVKTVEKDDVFAVPQRAVHEDAGGKYVNVLVGGADIRKDVQVGVFGDDGLVEIVSGLASGDAVVVGVRTNGKTGT